MPRALPGLALLLMAGLALAATPPLEIVNPWLSACDLQPASAADLQGACSAMWGPGPLCLPPCPANSSSTTQCLYYLKESHKEEVCGHGFSPERRRNVLHGLRMRHCCEHAVDSALALSELVLQGGAPCRHLLDALLEVDALAARISCEFAEVLTRYDCSQNYSIAHRCEDCKEAYRRWVCSSLVPHFTSTGRRVRPCLNVCQNVEQQCPYMLPGDRAPAHPTQYAGEPTFLCLDPNIPETGEQRVKSSRGDEDCCYSHCGSPGRGVRGTGVSGPGPGICEHCPGRPSNDTPEPVRCAAGVATKLSGCRAGAPSGASNSKPRTLNKVYPLWTAWILLIHIQTLINLIQCLLVLCATTVRTSLTWIKTKWRSCS